MPTYSLQRGTALNLRARVRDEYATVQATGASGYSSGAPGAQCQGHKDRTVEALLSSGYLQGFCGNAKLQARPGFPCTLLCTLSLSRNGCPARAHSTSRTHPAAQLVVGGSALTPPRTRSTSHYTQHHAPGVVVGVAAAAAGAEAAAADEQHQAEAGPRCQWRIAPALQLLGAWALRPHYRPKKLMGWRKLMGWVLWVFVGKLRR